MSEKIRAMIVMFLLVLFALAGLLALSFMLAEKAGLV